MRLSGTVSVRSDTAVASVYLGWGCYWFCFRQIMTIMEVMKLCIQMCTALQCKCIEDTTTSQYNNIFIYMNRLKVEKVIQSSCWKFE